MKILYYRIMTHFFDFLFDHTKLKFFYIKAEINFKEYINLKQQKREDEELSRFIDN